MYIYVHVCLFVYIMRTQIIITKPMNARKFHSSHGWIEIQDGLVALLRNQLSIYD